MQLFQSFGICLCVVIITIIIHHEALMLIGKTVLPRFRSPKRWHVSLAVLIIILAHVLEILIWALGLYISTDYLYLGELRGVEAHEFTAYLYYAFASYTSLGIGDIFPIGFIRLITGMAALVGLLMIGWTASFLLLEMRPYWSVADKR